MRRSRVPRSPAPSIMAMHPIRIRIRMERPSATLERIAFARRFAPDCIRRRSPGRGYRHLVRRNRELRHRSFVFPMRVRKVGYGRRFRPQRFNSAKSVASEESHSRSPIRNCAARSSLMCGGPSPGFGNSGAGANDIVRYSASSHLPAFCRA